jgi:hypothetical protein
MGLHQHVCEISHIMQRSLLFQFFTHYTDTDDVIIVHFLLKLSLHELTCSLFRATHYFQGSHTA